MGLPVQQYKFRSDSFRSLAEGEPGEVLIDFDNEGKPKAADVNGIRSGGGGDEGSGGGGGYGGGGGFGIGGDGDGDGRYGGGGGVSGGRGGEYSGGGYGGGGCGVVDEGGNFVPLVHD